ncbi:MAG: M4 family metallopeptidase, partial [Sediminibacterium sp.]|nr:M4 family metallopeptidase [Sediminibacterium sp.]
MKKILILLILCSNYFLAISQETQVGDTAEVYRNHGKFSYAVFKKQKRKVPQNDTMFLKKFFKANRHTSYKLIYRNNNGRKYQVYYKGIEVEGYNIDVGGDSNTINTIWHDHPNINIPSVKPLISDTLAIKKAYLSMPTKFNPYWNDSFYKYIKKPTLLIVEDYNKNFRLAYKVPEIYWVFDTTGPYLLKEIQPFGAYIDALDTSVIKIITLSYNLGIDTGIAQTLYNSIQKINTSFVPNQGYKLTEIRHNTDLQTIQYGADLTNYLIIKNRIRKGELFESINLPILADTNIENKNFYDNDNIWTKAEWDNDNKDIVALDAHWGMEKILDYWKLKFNRESYDSLNTPVVNIINAPENVNPSLNASFRQINNIGRIYIGDGGYDNDYNWVDKPYVSLDILAHEFAHGITITSSNLFYGGESGALNEGFSDIWGAVIENYYTPNKQKWRIGEEVIGNGNGLRNMQNPKELANPKVYKGRFWQTDLVPRKNIFKQDSNDFGGVHTNSGVLGYWFYLLTEGGKGYIDDSAHKPYFVVNGIGIDKAAKIAYYTQIKKMGGLTINASYNDAKDVSLQITKDSFGMNSLEYLAVAKAWYAVGVLDTMPRKYIISPKAANGTIYPKTPIIFNPGDSQTYTLTPNFGYLIDSLYINDSVITPLNLSEYTFKNIQKDYNIKVVFKPKVYTLTTRVYNGNTTLPDTLLVKHDTSIRFGFTTNIPNYTFDYIDINGKIFRDSTIALTYKIIDTTNIKIYFSLQSEPRIVRFNRYLAKRNDTLYVQGRGLQKFLFKKGNYDDSFYITQIISKTKLPNGDTAYSIIIPNNLEEKIYIVYGLNNLNQRSNYYLLRIYGQDCLVPIIWRASNNYSSNYDFSNYTDSLLNTQTANLHNIVEMKIGSSNIITLDNLGQPKLIYSTSLQNIILPNNLRDIVKVTISEDDHILLLKSDGTVIGYAYNNIEQGVLDFPENLNNVIDISGTLFMSYILKTNGLVEGYGGKKLYHNIISSSLQTPQNFRDIVEIKSGSLFTLVKFKNNTVNLFGPESADIYSYINLFREDVFFNMPAYVNNVNLMDINNNISVVQKLDSTYFLWGRNQYNHPASNFNNNTIKVKKIAIGYYNLLLITTQD